MITSFRGTRVGERECHGWSLTMRCGLVINSFRQALTENGTTVVIPSKKNRLNPIVHDHHIYKERNIVERFFQKIKRFRRIATRYDKTARMYLTGVMFVSILLALK